jgi:spore germination protein KC
MSGVINTNDILYYLILKSNSKIKVNLNKDLPSIQVNVKVTADLRKYYSKKGSEFLTPEEISKIESKLADRIRSDAEAAINKAQKEYKSDIFGFGFELFRKNPKLWRTQYEEKWDEIFPDIPVEIKVNAKVINTGVNIRKLTIK